MKTLPRIIGLVTLLSAIPAYSAHQFTWDDLNLAAAKLQPNYDYEIYSDSWMKVYRKPIWDRFKNDEFELEDRRQETITIMKSKVDKFSLSEKFELNTSFKIGKYDFRTEEFPLDSISPNSYFRARGVWGAEPPEYQIFFTNPEIIGNLKMPKDEARGFVKKRKDAYGNIDRDVQVRVYFSPIALRSKSNQIDAKISRVVIFGGKHRTNILQEFRAPGVAQ